ncbi:MAG TPA: hypothetical protein VFE08_14535 [Candidatus Sulfotelmatobacter sp.]|jgi:hypothetical protein|nr:hypothetical protein [Candidatus Sulfotelmatobacter sp.]
MTDDPKVEIIEYPMHDGDPFIVEANGNRYTVEFHEDYDATPLDADCYDESDIQAWRDDQWRYIGVTVTSEEFTDVSDDLWGLEFNYPLDPPQVINGRTFRYTDADYQTLHYPVPGMIAGIEKTVESRKGWRHTVRKLYPFRR